LDSSSCDVYSENSSGWQKLLSIKGSPGISERFVNAQWNFTDQRTSTVTDCLVFAPIFDNDLAALPGFNLSPNFFREIFRRARTQEPSLWTDLTFLLKWNFFGWILDLSDGGYASVAGIGLCLGFSLRFVKAFNTI